jgi:UDP-glucose 4-epimerase
MRRILVTGGRGFIGDATCRAIENRGDVPVVVDIDNGQPADILTDPLPDVDHIIHLAGILGTDELFDEVDRAIDVNVKGTLRVLQHAERIGAGYTGITQPDVFPSVYTATKLCATHLAKAWHYTYNVPVSHVRAFNAYGPGQKHGPGHPRKIIPAFATEAWAGDPLIVWGDGWQTVDLVHVDDVAQMLVDATSFGNCELFDAGTGHQLSVNQVASMVIELTGSTSTVEHRPMRRGELATRIGAKGVGWDLLEWRPAWSRTRLERTIDSYRP